MAKRTLKFVVKGQIFLFFKVQRQPLSFICKCSKKKKNSLWIGKSRWDGIRQSKMYLTWKGFQYIILGSFLYLFEGITITVLSNYILLNIFIYSIVISYIINHNLTGNPVIMLGANIVTQLSLKNYIVTFQKKINIVHFVISDYKLLSRFSECIIKLFS